MEPLSARQRRTCMRTVITLAALLLTLTACAGGADDETATDPGSAPGTSDQDRPTEVPAAPGPVRTRTLATVMDTGRPELCVGPIAESYPPQCGGPEITNWDWAEHDGRFDQQGKIRWGSFAVTGTWDGTAFTVDEAVPAALYDAGPEEPPKLPEPEKDLTDAELQRLVDNLAGLPGAMGGYADDGHVLVDVLYDDGSLQAWADQEYGKNVLLVTSMLVDVT